MPGEQVEQPVHPERNAAIEVVPSLPGQVGLECGNLEILLDINREVMCNQGARPALRIVGLETASGMPGLVAAAVEQGGRHQALQPRM